MIIAEMTNPLLTIGIPTFNRAVFLEELLGKIVPACDQLGIGVLVSDNCSTDQTAKASDKFKKYSCFHYQKTPKNLGFDGNILELFNKARGEFLWLMGDDDYPDARQFKNLLELLTSNPNVGLCFLNYKSMELIKWDAGAPAKLEYRRIDPQTYVDTMLHKATLISTNIINLHYFKQIQVNPACLGQHWMQLHIFIRLCDFFKAKNIYNLVISNDIIAQRSGRQQLTSIWVRSFVCSFMATLQNTAVSTLKITEFKRNFFKLNIIHQFNRIGEVMPWSHCLYFYRKVIEVFPVTLGEKIGFFINNFLQWLAHSLLFYVLADLPSCGAQNGKVGVGSQAVVEGVLMYSPSTWAMVVCDPSQNMEVRDHSKHIVIQKGQRSAWTQRHFILRWPIVRGIVIVLEALALGMMAMDRSADITIGKQNQSISVGERIFSDLTCFVIFCLLFLVAPASIFLNLQGLGWAVLWLCLIEGIFCIAIFGVLRWVGTLMPDMRRIFGYYGGAQLATKSENPRPAGGTNFILAFFAVSVFIFAIIGMPGFWLRVAVKLLLLPLVAGLAYEVVNFARFWPVPVLPPTENQFGVALAALKELKANDAH